MNIDFEKLSRLLESELKELAYGIHDNSKVCIGEMELPNGATAQIIITVSVDENDFIDEPSEAFRCV